MRGNTIGIAALCAVFLLTACATAAPVEQATEEPTEQPTEAPTEIPTEAPTATPVPVDPLDIGDPERGRLIYETGADLLGNPCQNCHLDESKSEYGPPLPGIAERAGSTVEGMSSVDYLRESIVDPDAYLVEGYDNSMDPFYTLLLSEEDVENLVAFLLTR